MGISPCTVSYTINNRLYSALPSDRAVSLEKSCLFDLNHLGCVTIHGDHAAKFLQGQLTADIRKISDTQMQQAAYCNLQGRILALMDAVSWQGHHLIMPCDLIPSLKKSLTLTAQLSRVRVDDNEEIRAFGLYANPLDAHPEEAHFPLGLRATSQLAPLGLYSTDKACVYALGDGFFMVLTHTAHADELIEHFMRQSQYCGSALWHRLQLGRLSPEIYPLSLGLYLPHRLELHKKGHISFDKGCYKGQEIIARMHYRATIKHGLKLFLLDNQEAMLGESLGLQLLNPGMKIFTVDKSMELGYVVDFCPYGPAHYLVLASVLFEHPLEISFEGQPSIYPIMPFKET